MRKEHKVGITPIQLARHFHSLYENLAPAFGYETRKETKEFDLKSNNGRLMVEVCRRVLEDLQNPEKIK
jgi:hypothetical protein